MDEHKAYQFLREHHHCYFMLDQSLPAYRAEMWKLRKIQKLKTILLQRPKQLQLLKGKPQQMRRVLTEEQAGFPGPDWYIHIQAQLARKVRGETSVLYNHITIQQVYVIVHTRIHPALTGHIWTHFYHATHK